MSDSKSFASLSSSLLARRGHAKPAMRPQAIQLEHGNASSLEDLGWNDMGFDMDPVHPQAPVEPAPAPLHLSPAEIEPIRDDVDYGSFEHEQPPVVEQQAVIAREFGALSPMTSPRNASMPTPRAAAGGKAKAAFTLRLDPDRHLRLRLVCAVQHRSAQQIVTAALDEFLEKHDVRTQLNSGLSGL